MNDVEDLIVSPEDASQLRLALIELSRMEREIAALEAQPHDAPQRDLLMSLRSCRAVLLRMADARLRRTDRREVEA